MIKYELDCLEKVINHYWTDCKVNLLAGRPNVHNEMLTLIAVLKYEQAIIKKDELLQSFDHNLTSGRYKTCGHGCPLYAGPDGDYDEVACGHPKAPAGNYCGNFKCPLDNFKKE